VQPYRPGRQNTPQTALGQAHVFEDLDVPSGGSFALFSLQAAKSNTINNLAILGLSFKSVLGFEYPLRTSNQHEFVIT